MSVILRERPLEPNGAQRLGSPPWIVVCQILAWRLPQDDTFAAEV
jgi:hypothetical protein